MHYKSKRVDIITSIIHRVTSIDLTDGYLTDGKAGNHNRVLYLRSF